MWSVRWAGCVALVVAGLVLGEPHLSFHPPVYYYEFGDLSDQTIHYATVGHIRPSQRFAKIDLKAYPCVRRERYVRVVVLNAHNPAHVSVRPHAVYIHYMRGEHTQSTYIVWASRTGTQDPACLHRLRAQDIQSNHRKRLVQYQLQKPMTLQPRQGYHLKQDYYPGHLMSQNQGRRQQWHKEDGLSNKLEGRRGNAHESQHEDSIYDDSSELSKDVGDEPNNEVFNEERDEEKNDPKHEPIWKLKRQRKNYDKTMESTSPINNVEVQDIEDPFNMTETVKYGLNTNIFRRTSPVRTVKEDIIEEYIAPQKFISQSTIPSGMSVVPGFTYQFFNLPSSSEASAVSLPPSGNLPKDQSEWDAYFKNVIVNNSTMIGTEMPMLAGAAPPIVSSAG